VYKLQMGHTLIRCFISVGNDDPSRVGDAANPLLRGSQLSTDIGFGDGGLRVRELSRAHNVRNFMIPDASIAITDSVSQYVEIQPRQGQQVTSGCIQPDRYAMRLTKHKQANG
jgi:hypothetical protein